MVHPTSVKPSATELPVLPLPERFNYIAVFLTLACNLRCSFCINYFDKLEDKGKTIPGKEWIKGLNRLRSRPDLPVTLQGGEPSLHRDFLDVVGGLRPELPVDILTNLQFDVEEFIRRVPPERVRRDAPYASIRVSYHPEVMRLEDIKDKVLRLLEKGYSVGIWGVLHPTQFEEIERAREECREAGIDFRTKEFLGSHEGELHGSFKYPDSLALKRGPKVRCRTSELIVGPGGHVFRCHGDLYGGREPVGRLCDPDFVIEDVFRPCDCYGFCNPCDVKVKTNRFQQSGHTSVDIEFEEKNS